MRATRNLPANYQPGFSFDLKNDLRLALALNAAAIGVFVLVYPGVRWIASRLHPDSPDMAEIAQGDGLLLALGIVLTVIVHEMLHGAFFWLFTKTPPVFGIKLWYAFASAPGWYLAAVPFLVTGLAPLVGITALGTACLLIIPDTLISEAVLLISLNAAGSAGDLYVVARLLRQPKGVLVEDQGESIRFYLPGL